MSQNTDHSANIGLARVLGTRRYGQVAYMTQVMSVLDDFPEQAPKRPIHSPAQITVSDKPASLTWRFEPVGQYRTTTTARRTQIKVAGRRKSVIQVSTHSDPEGYKVALAFGTHGPSLQEVSDALAVERFLRQAVGKPVMVARGRGRKVAGVVWLRPGESTVAGQRLIA